jgi:transcription antitermination factor NusB
MRKRTQARELALQLLYQLDLRGEEVVPDLLEHLASVHDPEVRDFARGLVEGYRERAADIDRRIEEVARNWQLRRMAVIDRNILRLATFELLYRDDVPPLVSINEAIELAKKYSTKNSGPFVNGILDNLRLRHQKEKTEDRRPKPGKE